MNDARYAYDVQPADGESETWHDDVRFFRLADSGSGEAGGVPCGER